MLIELLKLGIIVENSGVAWWDHLVSVKHGI